LVRGRKQEKRSTKDERGEEFRRKTIQDAPNETRFQGHGEREKGGGISISEGLNESKVFRRGGKKASEMNDERRKVKKDGDF